MWKATAATTLVGWVVMPGPATDFILTTREREVLRLVAEGNSNAGSALHLTEHTSRRTSAGC